MSKEINIHDISSTLLNLLIFCIALAAFVMVFFFPTETGEIVGKIYNGTTTTYKR
jgi:hypothetical protein